MRFRNGVELRATIEFDPTTGSAQLSVSQVVRKDSRPIESCRPRVGTPRDSCRPFRSWSQRAASAKGAGGIERQRLDRVHESRTLFQATGTVDALETRARSLTRARYGRDRGTIGV